MKPNDHRLKLKKTIRPSAAPDQQRCRWHLAGEIVSAGKMGCAAYPLRPAWGLAQLPISVMHGEILFCIHLLP